MSAFRRLLDGDVPAARRPEQERGQEGLARALPHRRPDQLRPRPPLRPRARHLRLGAEGPLRQDEGQGLELLAGHHERAGPEQDAGAAQGTAVAVMTYAGDLFSWYAARWTRTSYFCPSGTAPTTAASTSRTRPPSATRGTASTSSSPLPRGPPSATARRATSPRTRPRSSRAWWRRRGTTSTRRPPPASSGADADREAAPGPPRLDGRSESVRTQVLALSATYASSTARTTGPTRPSSPGSTIR